MLVYPALQTYLKNTGIEYLKRVKKLEGNIAHSFNKRAHLLSTNSVHWCSDQQRYFPLFPKRSGPALEPSPPPIQ